MHRGLAPPVGPVSSPGALVVVTSPGARLGRSLAQVSQLAYVPEDEEEEEDEDKLEEGQEEMREQRTPMSGK
jgi:hypothetical protein